MTQAVVGSNVRMKYDDDDDRTCAVVVVDEDDQVRNVFEDLENNRE